MEEHQPVVDQREPHTGGVAIRGQPAGDNPQGLRSLRIVGYSHPFIEFPVLIPGCPGNDFKPCGRHERRQLCQWQHPDMRWIPQIFDRVLQLRLAGIFRGNHVGDYQSPARSQDAEDFREDS